jgi:hypothetical protein
MLLAASPATAQQQLPPLPTLLDRLYDYTAQYRATLPSLECHEQILSEQVDYKGKVKLKVRVEGTIREVRKSPPDPTNPFEESHVVAKPRGVVGIDFTDMPYFIQGGFANLIAFHHGRLRDCFDYRISPYQDGRNVEVIADRNTNSPEQVCHAILPGTHYRVIADVATGRILHSERTISAQAAEEHGEAYFAAMDYAPWQFGDDVFWVPSRFEAHDPTETGRMEATYTKCHRYGSEIKILPSVTEAGPGAKPQ